MENRHRVLVMLGWHEPRFLAGIADCAREHHWSLELRPLYERELLWHWNGDGALLSLGADPECNKRVLELARLFPAVSFSGNILGSTQTVTTDQAAGGVLAAHHFLELGYRNFAWFETPHDPSGDRIGEMRGAAFRQTVETAGYNCAVLERLGSDAADRKQRTICRQRLLAQLLELPKPLALFAFDDPHAVDAIEMCLDAGLRVPEDVAVLGVGNLELACECSMVPISSVEYDLRAIGYAGACLLEQVMAGNPAPDPMPPFAPVRVVARRSTCHLATEEPRILVAIRFMREHLAEDFAVEDIAAAAGLSIRALQNLFKVQLRRVPAHFLLQLRLDLARRLLLDSELSIEAIAVESGLKSARNINRCFHRELGISPSSFRGIRPHFTPEIPDFPLDHG